ADPVLQRARDWLNVVVFCFWTVDDDIRFQQRHRNWGALDHPAIWDADVSRIASPEINQLRAFAFRHCGHAGDLHAVEGVEELAGGFGDLHARPDFLRQPNHASDDGWVRRASFFGGVVDRLVGLD